MTAPLKESGSQRPFLVCGSCGGSDAPESDGFVKHAESCPFGGTLTHLQEAVTGMNDELAECRAAIPDTPEFDFLAGKSLAECIKALVIALSNSSRWIPVSERLPSVSDRPIPGYDGLSDDVLIYGDGDCDVAARDTLEGGWYSVQRATYLNESDITHWMPLPAAPEPKPIVCSQFGSLAECREPSQCKRPECGYTEPKP